MRPSALFAEELGMYEPPDLAGYVLYKSRLIDADEPPDGIKESLLEKFRTSDGKKVFRISTRGYVWAWSKKNAQDTNSSKENYVIVDSDGDGIFDVRYSLKEIFGRPSYLK